MPDHADPQTVMGLEKINPNELRIFLFFHFCISLVILRGLLGTTCSDVIKYYKFHGLTQLKCILSHLGNLESEIKAILTLKVLGEDPSLPLSNFWWLWTVLVVMSHLWWSLICHASLQSLLSDTGFHGRSDPERGKGLLCLRSPRQHGKHHWHRSNWHQGSRMSRERIHPPNRCLNFTYRISLPPILCLTRGGQAAWLRRPGMPPYLLGDK